MTRPLPPSAGVIGWPVAHSKSPLIHRFWLNKLGLDGDYGRFPVHPAGLGAAIRALPALGLRGVNVAVPHKTAVMAHLDVIDPLAARVGAVNTVVVGEDGRLSGYNSDVAGVLAPMALFPAADSYVLVGAGGAARAVLVALAERQVPVCNRDRGRAQALVAELGGRAAGLDDLVRVRGQVIINASVLGMAGQPPVPVDLADWADDTIVFDMVYAPLETPLLAAARARGLRTIDGLQMLVAQAAAAFEHFFGVAAPRAHDAELRALLTA